VTGSYDPGKSRGSASCLPVALVGEKTLQKHNSCGTDISVDVILEWLMQAMSVEALTW